MYSVSVDEPIANEAKESFVAYHCNKAQINKDKARVFYCEGIKTYEFYPFCTLLDDRLFGGFEALQESVKEQYKLNTNEINANRLKNDAIECDLFLFKKAFVVYCQDKGEIVYFKDDIKLKKYNISDVQEYIGFVFAGGIKIQNVYKIKKSVLIKYAKEQNTNTTSKTQANIGAFGKRAKLVYLFVSYILLCFCMLLYLLFVATGATNTSKHPLQAKIKYNKDIYLGLYEFIKIAHNKRLHIVGVSFKGNKLNAIISSPSNKKLLKFALKYKSKIKLKSIQKINKVYVMDIVYAI